MTTFCPSISAIICTKDRPIQLQTCLHTIRAQSMKVKEIIVVDASDRYHAQIEALCIAEREHCIVIYIRTSPGLPRQRNIGLLAATGTYCLFIDDDCELAPDAVQAFAKTLDLLKNDKHLGAIAGKIIEPFENATGLKIVLGRIVEQTFCKLFFLQRKGNGNYLPSGQPTFCKSLQGKYCQQIHGGFSLVNCTVAKSVRFDETLCGYAYMEDDDFAVRLTLNGFSNYYQPLAQAIHRHSKTGREPSFTVGKMFVRNWYYLFCKNFLGKQGNAAAFALALAAQPVFSLLKGRPIRAAGELCAIFTILKSLLWPLFLKGGNYP